MEADQQTDSMKKQSTLFSVYLYCIVWTIRRCCARLFAVHYSLTYAMWSKNIQPKWLRQWLKMTAIIRTGQKGKKKCSHKYAYDTTIRIYNPISDKLLFGYWNDGRLAIERGWRGEGGLYGSCIRKNDEQEKFCPKITIHFSACTMHSGYSAMNRVTNTPKRFSAQTGIFDILKCTRNPPDQKRKRKENVTGRKMAAQFPIQWIGDRIDFWLFTTPRIMFANSPFDDN